MIAATDVHTTCRRCGHEAPLPQMWTIGEVVEFFSDLNFTRRDIRGLVERDPVRLAPAYELSGGAFLWRRETWVRFAIRTRLFEPVDRSDEGLHRIAQTLDDLWNPVKPRDEEPS